MSGFTQLTDLGRHPGRLPTQIHIVRSLPGTGVHQHIAVTLIRTNRRDHQPGLSDERRDRRRIRGLSHQQRHGLWCTDSQPDGLEFFEATPGHGPTQRLFSRINRLQHFSNEATGISSGTKQNNIESHQPMNPEFEQIEP